MDLPAQRLAAQIRAWQKGVASEIKFWDDWVANRGGPYGADFEERLSGKSIFPSRLVPPSFSEGILRVLDVGAGPVTILGPVGTGADISLTACDPLAPFYAEIAARHGVDWPVKTEQAFAEELTAYYNVEWFDVVYCRNALDHSMDPVRGLEEMYLVAKKAGRINLEHAVDEAQHAEYDGLHQWNFDEEGGRFIIWNKTERVDVTHHFAGRANISVVKDGRWLTVIIDKIPTQLPDASGHHRNRIKQIMSGLLLSAALGADDNAKSEQAATVDGLMAPDTQPSVAGASPTETPPARAGMRILQRLRARIAAGNGS